MITRLMQNWRTTSAGLTAIITAVISLVFAIKGGHADQTMWTVSLIAILNGIGLVAAGDAKSSEKQVGQLAQKVESNTAMLKKVNGSKP